MLPAQQEQLFQQLIQPQQQQLSGTVNTTRLSGDGAETVVIALLSFRVPLLNLFFGRFK